MYRMFYKVPEYQSYAFNGHFILSWIRVNLNFLNTVIYDFDYDVRQGASGDMAIF